eukprot:6394516-Amphidinium_carterae.3
MLTQRFSGAKYRHPAASGRKGLRQQLRRIRAGRLVPAVRCALCSVSDGRAVQTKKIQAQTTAEPSRAVAPAPKWSTSRAESAPPQRRMQQSKNQLCS